MTNRLSVEPGRLVNLLIAAAILLLVVSLANSFLFVFVLAALAGALIGAAVFMLRARHGLGATIIGEQAPEYAGKVGIINMAHIPVMGVGGLGIVAMAVVVALALPEGRTQLAWGMTGAVLGAGTLILWRHFTGSAPFAEHPEETLHLR